MPYKLVASYDRALVALLSSRLTAAGRKSVVPDFESSCRDSTDHRNIGRCIDAFDLALESL